MNRMLIPMMMFAESRRLNDIDRDENDDAQLFFLPR